MDGPATDCERAETPIIANDLQILLDQGDRFGCIYADPPWQYKNRSSRGAAENHYSTMSLEDITALPVCRLAADHAHLHLWVPSGFLFDAEKVIEAWGFEYKSSFVWLKERIGMGNYWRVSHEFLLLGVRGNLPFRDRSLRSWQLHRRTTHSTKPDSIRMSIEHASPGPYLELFGRRTCPGWTVFGNQVQRHLF